MNIIELAREAGFDWHSGWTLDDDEPNRFATFATAVIKAHEAKLIAGAGEPVAARLWVGSYAGEEGENQYVYSEDGDGEPLYTQSQLAAAVLNAESEGVKRGLEFEYTRLLERIATLESTLKVALEVLAINQYAVADQAPHKDVMNYNALIEKIEEVLHD